MFNRNYVFRNLSYYKWRRYCVQCKKKHLTICPEFTSTGSCPRGRGCPLRHVAKRRRVVDASTKTEQNTVG